MQSNKKRILDYETICRKMWKSDRLTTLEPVGTIFVEVDENTVNVVDHLLSVDLSSLDSLLNFFIHNKLDAFNGRQLDVSWMPRLGSLLTISYRIKMTSQFADRTSASLAEDCTNTECQNHTYFLTISSRIRPGITASAGVCSPLIPARPLFSKMNCIDLSNQRLWAL